MKRIAKLALLVLAGAPVAMADDAAPKIQFFTAAELAAQRAQPKDGLVSSQFLNTPGGHVYLVRRDDRNELIEESIDIRLK